ncbi:MAG TPA: hypothetical protein PK095_13745, partial [Myxococcota bacterium]|nr:hypothetical protein [Myxococcota bacterium]
LHAVTTLVRTAIEHLEARATPEVPPLSRPDSNELVDALHTAAAEARQPGAEDLIRALLANSRLKPYEVDRVIRAIGELGRSVPSDKDLEDLKLLAMNVKARRREDLAPLVRAIFAFLEAYGRWRPRG